MIIFRPGAGSSDWYRRFAEMMPVRPSTSKEEADGDHVGGRKGQGCHPHRDRHQRIQDRLGISNLYCLRTLSCRLYGQRPYSGAVPARPCD